MNNIQKMPDIDWYNLLDRLRKYITVTNMYQSKGHQNLPIIKYGATTGVGILYDAKYSEVDLVIGMQYTVVIHERNNTKNKEKQKSLTHILHK